MSSEPLAKLAEEFFQAEDGIRDQPRSRGLGDVYKRQFQNQRLKLTVMEFGGHWLQ